MARYVLVVCLIGFAVGSPSVCVADEPIGWLKSEQKAANKKPKQEIIPYAPREGDLVFYDDRSFFWTVLFTWVGSGPPLHMGIVVKKSDDALAILEAGPDDTVWVSLLDLDKRLRQFAQDYPGGAITIRRCKKALSKEQSAALTKFAHAQDGKRYAVGRLLLEGTCLRVRGPIRERVLGGTYLDRDSWMCAELAVAAASRVKLIDGAAIKANATYPRDIVDNQRHDLRASWHDPAVWLAERKK